MTTEEVLEIIFASPNVDLRLNERPMKINELSINERYDFLVFNNHGTRVDSEFNVPRDYVLQRSLSRKDLSGEKIYIGLHSGYEINRFSEGAD